MINSTVSRLSELSGLEGAKNAILRLVRPDSGVHAVLLYGSQGAGKESLAEALAQAWLCTNPTPDGACGECRACEAFGRDRSADLLRVVPRGPSEIIKLEAITEVEKPEDNLIPMIEFFRTAPLLGRHKVAAVYRADRMNKATANAFLKTLEEPSSYAKIVMTTSEIGLVLPTIVSRCVAIACELPEPGELVAEDTADWSLTLAEGAPGRLKHVLTNSEAYENISSFALKLTKAQPAHALALAEEFRGICDELEKALACNARAAGVEGLRALGAALSAVSYRDDWMREIAEAHRRIQGNANEGSVLDAMFATMLVN